MFDNIRLIFLVGLLVAAAASMVLPAGLGAYLDGPSSLPPVEANLALTRRGMAKTRITQEVIAGRLTLFEAAARFRRVNQMNPSNALCYKDDSTEDGLCRQVISWATGLLAREDPDNLAAVGERLDEELRRHKEQHGKVILPDLDDTD